MAGRERRWRYQLEKIRLIIIVNNESPLSSANNGMNNNRRKYERRRTRDDYEHMAGDKVDDLNIKAENERLGNEIGGDVRQILGFKG